MPEKKKTRKVKIGDKQLTIKKSQPHARVNKAKVIKLYAEGRQQSDIARLMKVSPAAISKCLAPYKDQLDELREYTENRVTFQDLAAQKMLNAILAKDCVDEKISSLSGAYKVLNDAKRLEAGESTQNVALKVVDLSRFANDNNENVTNGES